MRTRPTQAFGLWVPLFVLWAICSEGCRSHSEEPKDEPMPPSCIALADTLGRCFPASNIAETTRRGLPVIKKGDKGALAKRESECARNLADARKDCR